MVFPFRKQQKIGLFIPLNSSLWKRDRIYSSILLCTFGIWGIIVEESQAITEDFQENDSFLLPLQKLDHETPSLIVDAEVVQDLAAGDVSLIPQAIVLPEDSSDSFIENSLSPSLESLQLKVSIHDFWESNHNFVTAAPENFNPGLKLPPPEPIPIPSPSEAVETEIPKKNFTFPLEIESLTTNFKSDSDNFDLLNQFFEPTAYFRLPNRDRLSLQTGYNTFEQNNIEDISNVPVRIGWQREINRTTVSAVAGLDWFNRLPTTPYFYGKAETPIFAEVSPTGELESLLAISGELEYSRYKFNAKTLNNEITTLRFGPNLFWQINPNTSFFTTARYGNYSDDNQELLSFSRLERKLASFSIAANLFTWNYAEDLEQESGYFSPPDFLVYTGEIAWQGEVTDFLRCRVAATLGQQRLNGEWDLANSYQALCTTQISRRIELDLGYTFSNVQNRKTEKSVYNNHSIQGQLRIQF